MGDGLAPALGSRGGGVIAHADGSNGGRTLHAHHWLGAACWLGFLTPAQLRALPHHFRPLTFVASEGPLPDAVPLDAPMAWVTMLRSPLDRVLSSYRWWRLMVERMPQAPGGAGGAWAASILPHCVVGMLGGVPQAPSPTSHLSRKPRWCAAECRAYSAPASASLEQWLEAYPANWMTRELVGRTALYQRRKLTEADLLLAKRRLHYFAAVLLLEAPRSSMALMQRLFGWREVGWEAARAGSRHDSNATAELPPQLLQRLRQRNQLDMRLYDYAVALHAAQLLRAGLGV